MDLIEKLHKNTNKKELILRVYDIIVPYFTSLVIKGKGIILYRVLKAVALIIVRV